MKIKLFSLSLFIVILLFLIYAVAPMAGLTQSTATITVSFKRDRIGTDKSKIEGTVNIADNTFAANHLNRKYHWQKRQLLLRIDPQPFSVQSKTHLHGWNYQPKIDEVASVKL